MAGPSRVTPPPLEFDCDPGDIFDEFEEEWATAIKGVELAFERNEPKLAIARNEPKLAIYRNEPGIIGYQEKENNTCSTRRNKCHPDRRTDSTSSCYYYTPNRARQAPPSAKRS